MRRLTIRGRLATGLAIFGLSCDGQEATQPGAAAPAVVTEIRDTWSLKEGDDAMIVTPGHRPTFLDAGERMASLTEGTRVRFLGKGERDGYARIKVLEGPAEDLSGDVLRLELKPFQDARR